jgi:hypothetical protein
MKIIASSYEEFIAIMRHNPIILDDYIDHYYYGYIEPPRIVCYLTKNNYENNLSVL